MVIVLLMMVNNILVGGIPTPLKNHGVKASWDYEIPFPTEWKVIKFHGSKPLSSQSSCFMLTFSIKF